MSKVIIDEILLNQAFSTVVYREAEQMALEMGLNFEEIQKELQEATTLKEVEEILFKHFGNEIQIRVKS